MCDFFKELEEGRMAADETEEAGKGRDNIEQKPESIEEGPGLKE